MTTFVTVVVGVAFFVAMMACVALHEVGHMVPAKLFGVRVPQYFVGFGKTLWSTTQNGTEYGVKAWPLGGYVRLLGMVPPTRPGAKDTWLQRFADDARAAEWSEITDADRGHLFYEQATWKKLIMMAGGITMNLLIGFAMLWGVVGLHGTPTQVPQVASVTACVIETPRSDTTCRPSDPPSPAAAAGLRPGDRIVEFNGTAITDYPQLTALIRANGAGLAFIVVDRGGVRTPLAPVPTRINTVADPAHPGATIQAGWLGFTPATAMVKGGPGQAWSQVATMSSASVTGVVTLPVKTVQVVADMVQGKPRDTTSPVSVVGASVAAGEVATVSDVTVGDRVAWFVSLLASVNVFLAIFNVFPVPPLDGGHIAGALFEAVRRGIARLAGRPDPGPADTAKMLPASYLVGGILLIAGIVLIVADIISPVKIF